MTDEKDIGVASGDIDIAEDQMAQPPENADSQAQQQSAEEAAHDSSAPPEQHEPTKSFEDANEGEVPEGDDKEAMSSMLGDLLEEDSQASITKADSNAASVAEAEFQQLSQPADQPQPKNIELLIDVYLPISIELGRTKMSIAEILSLGPGSVVELNKLAGEPVDVLVNNKIVAKGEVVVIDEYFGVRITQLMTPKERLKLLGDEK